MAYSKKNMVVGALILGFVLLGVTVYFGASKFRVRIDRVENGDSAVAGTKAKKIFSTAEAEAAFRKGHEYLREQKLDDALKEFEKAAKLSPDSPVTHYWVGMTFFYKQEPEKAIAKFKKVLEIEPANYRSLAMIGKILSLDRSKLDDAIQYLNDSLSIEPEYADARFDLGRIYAMKGDLNRALAEFAVIFRTEPRYALYHYELGRIFESAKAVDKARQEYGRALQLDPGFSRAKEALDRLK